MQTYDVTKLDLAASGTNQINYCGVSDEYDESDEGDVTQINEKARSTLSTREQKPDTADKGCQSVSDCVCYCSRRNVFC